MVSPFFSGRIPQALCDHIDKYRSDSGESKTDILIKALAQYTGFTLNDNEPENFYTPIHERFQSIEQELTQLREEINKLKNNNQHKTNQLTLNIDTDNSSKKLDNNNQLDTVNNSEAIPETIEMSESSMAIALNFPRNRLRKFREKIQDGKLNANTSLPGTINKIPHLVKYSGESGEGEIKKRHTWIAIPNAKNTDNININTDNI